jgi:alpha-beta hydrolase superfamily lysophospholipase
MNQTRHEEMILTAEDGHKIHLQTWTPEGEPAGVIQLLHGLGEHSSRYGHVAKHCNEQGIAVYALDHYGHGKSDGLPGYVERFSVYLDGAKSLLDKIGNEQPSVPVFLLGHSMGGLIAVTLLLERQDAFRACILSGPAIETDEKPSPPAMFVVRILSLLMPTMPLLALDPTSVSRDPEVVRAYIADPLVNHGKLCARLIAEFSKAMDVAS